VERDNESVVVVIALPSASTIGSIAPLLAAALAFAPGSMVTVFETGGRGSILRDGEDSGVGAAVDGADPVAC